ncbi:MAG: hypothetical protein JW910_04870 [Anaerolineae bacterium]|nr:hypothetical protein [Anaerolineae bacterium]
MHHRAVYEWSTRDKVIYLLALLPFLVAFGGSVLLLGTISVVLSLVLIGLYLLGNVFQAACCVGCPYRGRYCPAFFGVYLANVLSTRFYAGRQFDLQVFKRYATFGELTVLSIFVVAGVGLATLNGWYVAALVGLIALHVALFLTVICPKCGYCETCPAGQMACRWFAR